jgi:hypothetical protein
MTPNRTTPRSGTAARLACAAVLALLWAAPAAASDTVVAVGSERGGAMEFAREWSRAWEAPGSGTAGRLLPFVTQGARARTDALLDRRAHLALMTAVEAAAAVRPGGGAAVLAALWPNHLHLLARDPKPPVFSGAAGPVRLEPNADALAAALWAAGSPIDDSRGVLRLDPDGLGAAWADFLAADPAAAGVWAGFHAAPVAEFAKAFSEGRAGWAPLSTALADALKAGGAPVFITPGPAAAYPGLRAPPANAAAVHTVLVARADAEGPWVDKILASLESLRDLLDPHPLAAAMDPAANQLLSALLPYHPAAAARHRLR